MAAPRRFKANEVVAALRRNHGVVLQAARELRCDPDTIRNYAKRYPSVARAFKSSREDIKDTLVTRWLDIVQDPLHDEHGKMVRFGLQTFAKDRGFGAVVRNELSGPEGQPIQTQALIDEKAHALLEEMADFKRSGASSSPNSGLEPSGNGGPSVGQPHG